MARIKDREKMRRIERVVEVFVDNPFMDFEEIAKLCNISLRTFYRYKAEPEFLALYDAKCKEKFRLLQNKAIKNLNELAEKKHWLATKYILDGNDFAGTQKVEVKDTTINVTVDEDGDDDGLD